MRRLATSSCAAAAAASCAQTVDVGQEKAALLTQDAEWAKTAGDPAKFITYFAPEGRLALNGMPEVQGEKAILDAVGPLMKSPGFHLQWKATRADVECVR